MALQYLWCDISQYWSDNSGGIGDENNCRDSISSVPACIRMYRRTVHGAVCNLYNPEQKVYNESKGYKQMKQVKMRTG